MNSESSQDESSILQQGATLDYAQDARSRTLTVVRRYLKPLTLVAVGVLVLWLAWRSGPGDYIRRAYWEHRCATMTMPPLTPIYSNDPIFVPAVQKRPSHLFGDFNDAPSGIVARSDEWMEFGGDVTHLHVLHGFVFSHSLFRPDGIRRLVAVQISPSTAVSIRNGPNAKLQSYSLDIAIQAEVIRPRTGVDARSRHFECFVSDAPQVRFEPFYDRLTIFFGSPDPADASHFTIDYELNDQAGTIDGRLNNDDTVNLELRNGPLKLRRGPFSFH